MRHKIILCGFALAGLSACGKKEAPIVPEVANQNQFAELKKAEWLIGNWENNSDQGKMSETWNRSNDSIYEGKAYFIAGKDTVFNESIRLTQQKDKLVYSAIVPSQNNGQPIEFTSTALEKNALTFENPDHDYPRKIVYRKLSADSVVAEISGFEKGQAKTESFGMARVK